MGRTTTGTNDHGDDLGAETSPVANLIRKVEVRDAPNLVRLWQHRNERTDGMTTMGMSHENCSHPRTPAGRAACRKLNQPSANGTRYGCDYCGAEKTSVNPITYNHRVGCPAMPKAARKSTMTPKPAAKTARKSRRTITDLPRIFKTAVTWADDHNFTTCVTDGANGTVRVLITSDAGETTLTYAPSNPEGVNAVSWRAAHTSIGTRMTSVNEVLAKLEGRS